MSINTIRMVGHRVNLTIDAGDFAGLPTYVTTPREIRQTMESAYRSVVGRSEGSMSYQWCSPGVIEISENVFEHRYAVEMSLYVLSEDGVTRQDKETRRIFLFYVRHDYR